MVKSNPVSEIELDGGLLCLDFVNSVPNRIDTPQPDYLTDIHVLIDWADRLKIIGEKTTRQLHAKADIDIKKATSFFRDAIAFRELLYAIFRHLSRGEKVPASDLDAYNNKVNAYFTFLQLKQVSAGFCEDWALKDRSFKKLLAPVIKNSYETLLSDKLNKIKACPNCGWLFYDATKNGKRRWCSMQSCGSNVKALNWYHRQKKK